MNINDITFEQSCCAKHSVAEVRVSSGWLSIMKDTVSGEYKVRQFGIDKMPLGGYEVKALDEVQVLLA